MMPEVPNADPEAPPIEFVGRTPSEWVGRVIDLAIDVLIVVLVVAVLAILAVFAYRRWLRPWLRQRRIDRRLRAGQGRDGWIDGSDAALVPPDDPEWFPRPR
jgi:membrane protein implicated in regulation of membrane protease activity